MQLWWDDYRKTVVVEVVRVEGERQKCGCGVGGEGRQQNYCGYGDSEEKTIKMWFQW